MARWIDCTVDSMLTTTPFLRPREGCDADADHLDRVVGTHLAHQRGDLRRADVEADDQILVGALSHHLRLAIRVVVLRIAGRDALRRPARQPIAKPFV